MNMLISGECCLETHSNYGENVGESPSMVSSPLWLTHWQRGLGCLNLYMCVGLPMMTQV